MRLRAYFIRPEEYRDLKRCDERDIFQRVQMGVALSAPEKLQAISSPWADWIRVLNKKYFDSWGKCYMR